MPTADEPRRTVRFTHEELEIVERAAESCDVATGAFIRWTALIGAAYWAAEMAASRVRGEPLPMGRRRNGVRGPVETGPVQSQKGANHGERARSVEGQVQSGDAGPAGEGP